MHSATAVSESADPIKSHLDNPYLNARKEWDERYGKLVDLSVFDREILPLIQDVSLSRLVRATGLSLRYVSLIRRGAKRPHPRHWRGFLAAAEEEA